MLLSWKYILLMSLSLQLMIGPYIVKFTMHSVLSIKYLFPYVLESQNVLSFLSFVVLLWDIMMTEMERQKQTF